MHKDVRLVLAANLRKAGEAKGIGPKRLQKWLNEETHVSQGYLSKLLSDDPPYCGLNVVEKLADGLGLLPWELLTDGDDALAMAWKRMLPGRQ